MSRRLCAIVLTVFIAASASGDLFACGDKFLRVGRSSRIQRYGAVHRSSILVYAPRWSAKGTKTFEKMLDKSGHKTTTVTTAPEMMKALAAAKYDVVITSYPDAAAVREQLASAASTPILLPVGYNLTKEQEADVSAHYRGVLRPEKMDDFQALAEIDRVIATELKRKPASARR